MKKCFCGYTTANAKSFSNHIRYGCKSKIVLKNCLECGEPLPKKIKPKDGRKFCSHKCYALWRSKNLLGDKATNYKDGKCKERQLLRSGLRLKIWRSKVFKRDNYTCQKCGDSSGGNLEAHHIKEFSNYPKLRYKTNNGLTLCKKCHKETNNYGYQKRNKI